MIRAGVVEKSSIGSVEVGRVGWQCDEQPSVEGPRLSGDQLVAQSVEAVDDVLLRTVLVRNITAHRRHDNVYSGVSWTIFFKNKNAQKWS